MTKKQGMDVAFRSAGGSATRRSVLITGALGSVPSHRRPPAGFRRREAESRPGDEVARQRVLQADGGGRGKIAAANADKFDFKAVGMKDERDFAAQVDAIENFVTQKYDIIVVAPANSKAMVTPIAKAVKAGVKVINIDVELDKDAKKAAGIDLAFFGPDNRAGAKLAGDALAKKLGPGGKVVSSKATPRPTTPCSASTASWIRSTRASCNCSTARPRIGRPRKPTP